MPTGKCTLIQTSVQKEAVIRISQFIVRKESEALARNCQIGLVKTALFNSGNLGLNIEEISEEIDKQMGLKNFPHSIIQSSIESPEGKEEIYSKDGKYFLENGANDQIIKTISERQETIDNFESTIKKKVKEKVAVEKTNSKIEDMAVVSSYEFLVSWFGSESSSIANSLKVRKQITMPSFPLNILDATLKKVEDSNTRDIIRKVITETFKDLEPDMGRLLYEILQNYLNLELLNIDPECRYLQKVAFSNKTLILDTNVLMALFLESDRAFKGINELFSIAKDLGVNLVMTKRTEQEWLWSLENANSQYQSVNAQRPSLLPSIEDIFISSFFKRKSNDSSLTWQGYYLQMRQIKSLSREKGISFWYKKEYDIDKLPSKEFFEPLWGRVYGCANLRGYQKSRPVCEHDAYHLLLVRKLREERASDILGPSCWFLTLDSSLFCADEGLNNFMQTPFDPPSSFMADMWVSIIAPFLGPEISESRLADAFAHLMSTHFASLPSRLSTDAVVELLGNWLPYDKLSDKDIIAILGDALVTKYYHELKEARIKDPTKVEELAAKVRKKIDEKVYGIFDSRLSEAELKKENAEKVSLEKETLLVAERQREKLILNLCLILGVMFAVPGLVFLIVGNIGNGISLTVAGIVFIVLSLRFRHLKVKGGPIEIEASQ